MCGFAVVSSAVYILLLYAYMYCIYYQDLISTVRCQIMHIKRWHSTGSQR